MGNDDARVGRSARGRSSMYGARWTLVPSSSEPWWRSGTGVRGAQQLSRMLDS